ncbi:MAG: SsrA-binding protein SmpB [Alphaproteobacteria bacterium]|nr:SsrA-binding protein SmpB [Alphaproteobacteria bacterium]
MAKKKSDKGEVERIAAVNRKARYNYTIEDVFEAGIALVGTEVKSLREGTANITDAYAVARHGEIILINSHIPEYHAGNRFNHEPRRPRKILLHRGQINKLRGLVDRGGMTLVPLKIYFNARGRAKIELALARGKKQYDKRASIKDRDWGRDKARLMRVRG